MNATSRHALRENVSVAKAYFQAIRDFTDEYDYHIKAFERHFASEEETWRAAVDELANFGVSYGEVGVSEEWLGVVEGWMREG